MKISEVENLNHGFYQIFWKSGGYSLASVGSNSAGEKWLSPINWISLVDCRKCMKKIWRYDVQEAEFIGGYKKFAPTTQ